MKTAVRSLALMALCLIPFAAAPARAVGIAQLRITEYGGPAHSVLNLSSETTTISFEVVSKQSNGNCKIQFGEALISAKVNTKGILSFNTHLKGNLGGHVLDVKVKMNARLSISGLALVGTYSIKGTYDGAPVNDSVLFDAVDTSAT